MKKDTSCVRGGVFPLHQHEVECVLELPQRKIEGFGQRKEKEDGQNAKQLQSNERFRILKLFELD